MREAGSAETPYGRDITSEGWFVLNLGDALAVRNDEKGGASDPIEPREHPFENVGVHLRILWSCDPNALYHAEAAQEGFLVLSDECVLIVEEEERRLRQWDYFHCPAGTSHVFVGAGGGACAILMIGARPDEPLRHPVSEVAEKYGASVAAAATGDPADARPLPLGGLHRRLVLRDPGRGWRADPRARPSRGRPDGSSHGDGDDLGRAARDELAGGSHSRSLLTSAQGCAVHSRHSGGRFSRNARKPS